MIINIIFKFFKEFVNNRVGTYLYKNEKENIPVNREGDDSYVKGKLYIHPERYDEYKWVLVGLDTYNNAAGNSTFANYGLTGQALYTEGSNAISGRSHNGAVALNLAGAVLAIAPEGGAFNSNGILFSGVLTAPNASDSTYSDFPITVVNAVNGPAELKGRLPDVTWTSVSIPNGAVTPVKSVAADTYERTKHLMMWLPWTSVDAPIL